MPGVALSIIIINLVVLSITKFSKCKRDKRRNCTKLSKVIGWRLRRVLGEPQGAVTRLALSSSISHYAGNPADVRGKKTHIDSTARINFKCIDSRYRSALPPQSDKHNDGRDSLRVNTQILKKYSKKKNQKRTCM